MFLAISAVSFSFHQCDYSIKILESNDGGSTIGDHDKMMGKLDNNNGNIFYTFIWKRAMACDKNNSNCI